MTRGKIFLIDDSGASVKAMSEGPYETEDILQRILAKTPDLLPGDQINPEAPRNWMLVKRELGVPDGQNKSDRWSIDHLFLDQDGIPTFVECKRASDGRARREVVAQMLDYAANGLSYWSVDTLRQAATETAIGRKTTLDAEVERLTGSGQEPDIQRYWKMVEQNLRDGKARLIFVADKIPSELKRLVEFLNEKMTDLDVLAVEIPQYRGEGLRAIVPRVIGLTEKSRIIKDSTSKKLPLSRDAFLTKCTHEAAAVFTEVLNRSDTGHFLTYWGTLSFSIRARVDTAGRDYASFVYCWPPKILEIYLAQLPLEPEESKRLRTEILSLGVFEEAGDFTLRASVNEKTKEKVRESIDIIFRTAERLVRQI